MSVLPLDYRLPANGARVLVGSTSYTFPPQNKRGLEAHCTDILKPASGQCGWPIVDFCRFLTGWSFRVSKVCQDATRNLSKSFGAFRLSLLHGSNHGAIDVGSFQVQIGAVQYVGS